MRGSPAVLGGEKVRTRPFPTWPIFGAEEERRLLGVLRSGKWGKLHGHEVAEFEQRFAAMHGCKHGIGVVNGTVSLRIALLAGGIGAENEVIVPPYTFLATATAVIEANAIPVFADINLEIFNLDPSLQDRRVGIPGFHRGRRRRRDKSGQGKVRQAYRRSRLALGGAEFYSSPGRHSRAPEEAISEKLFSHPENGGGGH